MKQDANSSGTGGIFTSYYGNRKLDRKVHYLIRTSVGLPRFIKCDASCLELAPKREWIGLNEATYKPLYLEKLDMLGISKVNSLISSLVTNALTEGRKPVLLCYEALHPPQVAQGQFCHRRIFAEWYKTKTGTKIEEL